ncbi:DUF6671 family protein [Sediminibacterium sp.]|uniref:DUF6671 family protein n=1 Tax=Sediminibacterium sp. TaxID=1917865 RepID=UPI003F7104BA
MFKDRRLVIATMHRKEQVLAPILESGLGVKSILPDHFNTDQWGTFSGEIERELDPIETARRKCLKAMELTGCDLGIASEGSFGPHPSLFFIQADDEFLLLIDSKNNIEIVCRELSTNTNFNSKTIHTETELLDFAEMVNFPTHGLILKGSNESNNCIHKGIINQDELVKIFNDLKHRNFLVQVETDMRAMYNPTRMSVIEVLARKLVTKVQSTCPQCEMPGFDITDRRAGLSCSLCGMPTKSTVAHISVCSHCGFTKEDLYPKGKTTEDPMYCDRCNP